jgi:hypothetical protein
VGLRAAARQLGTHAAEHSGQLTTFESHVRTALTDWSGAVAESYAYAAGLTAVRFRAVVTQLVLVEKALDSYATALERAQQTIGAVNQQLVRHSLPPGHEHTLRQQGGDALDSLRRSARLVAAGLEGARSALTMTCPDTGPTSKLLHDVKLAGSWIKQGTTRSNMELIGSGIGLWQVAFIVRRVHVSGKGRAGLVKALKLMRAGEHEIPVSKLSALDRFIRVAKGTSKFDAIMAGLNIYYGYQDFEHPSHSRGWMHDVDKTSGVASMAGGGLQLLNWSLTALKWSIGADAVDWEIPGLDVVSFVVTIAAAVFVTASAAWTAGEWIAHEIDAHWHTIVHGLDVARHWIAHETDSFLHWTVHEIDGCGHWIAGPFESWASHTQVGQFVEFDWPTPVVSSLVSGIENFF